MPTGQTQDPFDPNAPYNTQGGGHPRGQGGGLNRAFRRFGGPVANQGYGTLLDILQRQGATDPRLLNQQRAQLDLMNQQQMRATQGNLAGAGLTGTGAGQALLAAQGQAGVAGQANLTAQEAALQEQRKREDLQLMQLLFGPKFARRGLRNQLDIAKMQAGANQPGGLDIGSLLGTGVQAYGISQGIG